MKELLQAILEHYGSELAIAKADGSSQAVRAFLQPVTEKGLQAMKRAVDVLGEVPLGRYVYIGPPVPKLEETDAVKRGEETFEVCRYETLYLGDEVLYGWGLLKKHGGAEPWRN